MKYRQVIILILANLLAGCTGLAPKYERPTLDMPEKWTTEKIGQATKNDTLKNWWQAYQDPILQKLVDEALAHSDDVAIASTRLQQAKAQYDYSFSNQFPLLSTEGTASHLQSDLLKSNNVSLFGGLLSYEIDLWKKLASATAAAKATLLAASYNQDGIRLSVASTIAKLYFNVLALDTDIKIMQNMIHTQEESNRLVEKKFEIAAVDNLAQRQSEADLAAVKAELPQLIEQKDQAESSIIILLGRSPHQIFADTIKRGSDIDSLPVPPLIPENLPSKLLERRPDIAAAEQALIASNFNIGYARAAYFPSISLTSLLAVSSFDIQNLYTGTARIWTMGAALSGPVMDFGRTDSSVNLAIAKNQEQLAIYKESIRTAFKEVKDALSAQTNACNREKAQIDEQKALQDALHIAHLRFDNGYASYLEVLEIESKLYKAQIANVAAKLHRLNSSVDLYKAVGGGWQLQH